MKDFLLIGNTNAVTYKEFFPLLKEGKAGPGYTFNKKMYFIIRDDATEYARIEDGKKLAGVNSCAWYTTLPTPGRRKLELTKSYTPEEYPTYDNYSAINVDKVKDIPYDYDGLIGVPISVMEYDLSNFEILDRENCPVLNGEKIYKRLIVQRGFEIVGSLKGGAGPEYYTYGTPVVSGENKYARVLIKKDN